jgi:murein DD-endopeptidase MepM/ murein hydrolase activator NlpD
MHPLSVSFCVKSLLRKGSMIKNRARSPFPLLNLFPSSSIFQFGFIFALACLLLNVSSASAQTRGKRAVAKSEERSRRVDNEDLSEEDESDEPDDARPATPPANPQVRKTSLTYAPRPGQTVTDRPALTNDIIIISRAPEASANRPTLKPNMTGPASNYMPSIWPVMGPLSSGFGGRHNPFGGAGYEFHKGQDIAAQWGTPVIATADGVVVSACWHKGYGNGIYIDHGNGIETRYGHLSRIDVTEGQQIKRGQQIGLVGSTGRSTGPHLHYEVRINGEAINPLPYLPSTAHQTEAQQPTARPTPQN